MLEPLVTWLVLAALWSALWAPFFWCCCAPSDYISTPGCPCSLTPATFYMHSNDTTGSNHMFQNATMQWGTTPAALLPLGLGASCYLSTASFLDYSTGDSFRYHIWCASGSYKLTRVYETSHYGSPYRDVERYTWPITGNTCSPWAMTHGTAYIGADPGVVVTLDTIPFFVSPFSGQPPPPDPAGNVFPSGLLR